MEVNDRSSLWRFISASDRLMERSLRSADAAVRLGELASGSMLGGWHEKLRGRSVLITTRDQVVAAAALIELDGIARRLVLCPPELARKQFPYVIATAEVDACVSDLETGEIEAPEIKRSVVCGTAIAPAACDRRASHETEWILFTSGTTGVPKLAVHSLASLAGPIKRDPNRLAPPVWSTFYDIRRYGGLQIFLRAVLDGGSLVVSGAEEPIGDFLVRAAAAGVTHMSGTPSSWRRALMSPPAHQLAPRYLRLSGEIVDQAILDSLRDFYPGSTVVHAFASTEAGVAFEVHDGLAGFPAEVIEQRGANVEIKIEAGSLRIRSTRAASGYLGDTSGTLADRDGFIDTRDLVELRGNRYYFLGRLDGAINVGGLKVYPEEIEAVINRHPSVLLSLVKSRRSSMTGALVTADVVVKPGFEPGAGNDGLQILEQDIIEFCRRSLAPYKVPVALRFVRSLDLSAAGKLVRP
ncbi:MAG: long-chain fatty acid--CoA ligase [Candidatus Binataceae bacterium]|nr:long-chain fatty acid--CoA ligase [Candidatus Binataceae bacterium]